MLVLALTQPYIFSDMMSEGNLIIVLDSSASMQSTDIEKSRFHSAKKEINEVFNNIKPETKVTLISMEIQPRIIVNGSTDKVTLQRKLESLKVSDASDNVKDTISLLKAMVQDMDNYQIVFYTDKDIEFELENMRVKKINGQGDNLAISNISYTFENDKLVVLTRIINYTDREYSTDVILYADNEIFDVKEIVLEPKEEKNVYWTNVPKSINTIKGELDIQDSLQLDNERYHVVSSNEISKVLLVTKGNIFLEKAVGLNQGVELYKTNEIIEDISGYDLYIYDGLLPDTLPVDGNIIMINPPENDVVKIINTSSSGELKLIDDGLFKYVNLDFTIGKTKVFEEADWSESVLLSNGAPIIMKGDMKSQKVLAMGFDLHDTDFPLKIDFPIFIQNALDYTLNLSSQEKVTALAGEYINVNVLPKTTEVYVTNPMGEKDKVGPPFPVAPYINTNHKGIYAIEEKFDSNIVKSYFVVNVDTHSESNIYSDLVDTDGEVNTAQNKVRAGRDLKNILLGVALILLALEWVVYNRGY